MRAALIALVAVACIGCAGHAEAARYHGAIGVQAPIEARALDLPPGVTVRALRYDEWAAMRTADPPLDLRVTQEQQGALIRAVADYWPEDPAGAYRVFVCESGGRADARENLPYVGIPQIDEGLHGVVSGVIRAQIEHARRIYDAAGGWRPWPVCGRLATTPNAR